MKNRKEGRKNINEKHGKCNSLSNIKHVYIFDGNFE